MALRPSDRISLVKEISSAMIGRDWSSTPLVFNEFGLTYGPISNGRPEWDQVITVLGTATDSQLLGLADHYDLGFIQAKATVEPKCWTPGYFRLFISHLAKYREEAGAIQGLLKPYGISSFVAHNDIEPTAEWQTEIENALATCDAMVALLREGFHTSRWTDQEIGYAMGRNRLVIAVRLGEDPYGFIGRFQGISGGALTQAALATQIFAILKHNDRTKDRIAYGLMANFVQSNSFREAKANMTLLCRAEYWDKSLSARCLEALEKNAQINGATGVPGQLANIIKSHEQKYA